MKLISLDNFIAALMVYGLIYAFPVYFNLDFLDPLQNTLQDFLVTDVVFSKIRSHEYVPMDTNIIIVNMGFLDRKGIAGELNIINKYNPKVVAIDGFFYKLKNPLLDDSLEKAFSNTKTLVLASKLVSYNKDKDKYDSLGVSNKKFTKNVITGFANVITKDDDEFRTVRKFFPVEEWGDTTEYFFSCVIASKYSPKLTKKFLDRKNDEEYINFRRDMKHYRVIDINEIFNPNADFSFIKDKIVLIGFLGPNIHTLVAEDVFFTPTNSEYAGRSLPNMYGLIVHANVISMILEQNYYNQLPTIIGYIISFLYIYFSMNLFSFVKSKSHFWFEPFSIGSVFVNMLLFFIIIVVIFYQLNFDLNIKIIFFGFLLIVPIYEFYYNTAKPFALSFIKWAYKMIIKIKYIFSKTKDD